MNTPESRFEVWSEVDNVALISQSFCDGQVAVFSQKCPTRGTGPNEDAALIFDVGSQQGVLAVADGVGGAAAGNRASRCVADRIVSFCSAVNHSDHQAPSGLRSNILDAIETANTEILEWGIGAGSTLIAIELLDGAIRSYHVGDSGAILVSNRGNIKFATVGHAPVALAIDIGMMHEEDGLVHEDRNLITNCLGSTEMKIEIGPPTQMAARDTLLLASDGLLDNLTQQEIATVISKGDLERQVAEVVNRAIERMTAPSDAGVPSKPDDLTVIAFRLN